MTPNADIILLTYSIALVGLTTGVQMWFVGAVRRRPMRFGGEPISPDRLWIVGVIFTVAGALACAVMAAEILSGAAGTDIRFFIGATIVVPTVVAGYNTLRDRKAPSGP